MLKTTGAEKHGFTPERIADLKKVAKELLNNLIDNGIKTIKK